MAGFVMLTLCSMLGFIIWTERKERREEEEKKAKAKKRDRRRRRKGGRSRDDNDAIAPEAIRTSPRDKMRQRKKADPTPARSPK